MTLNVKDLFKICDDMDNCCIDFAEWCGEKRLTFLPNKGWYFGSYEIEMGIFKTTNELLEIWKEERFKHLINK